MATNSKIEWTHHTFNPWRGCTKVSAGCANCYAETMSKRNPKVLGVWGDLGTRVVASESMWREPVKWAKAARDAGERHRVFCASLADVFEDRPDLHAPRRRMIELCHDTQDSLDWLLLTKRPENIIPSLERIANDYREEGLSSSAAWLDAWIEGRQVQPNVWLGTSVENQEYADQRIPHLLKCPAAVRFLSCEPLLGPIDLSKVLSFVFCNKCGYVGAARGHSTARRCNYEPAQVRSIDWVIVGGESGGGARPCHIDWIRDIVKQCKEAGVACFTKQTGSILAKELGSSDSKGGRMEDWPEDIRVREFPHAVQRP